MEIIADIIYSDGFIRLSQSAGTYFICQSFGDNTSVTETTYDDVITTIRESREESADMECTICLYSQAVCFA
jgi:hypothetical protein